MLQLTFYPNSAFGIMACHSLRELTATYYLLPTYLQAMIMQSFLTTGCIQVWLKYKLHFENSSGHLAAHLTAHSKIAITLAWFKNCQELRRKHLLLRQSIIAGLTNERETSSREKNQKLLRSSANSSSAVYDQDKKAKNARWFPLLCLLFFSLALLCRVMCGYRRRARNVEVFILRTIPLVL